MAIVITERGERDSCVGRVMQLKIFSQDYRALPWREVWDAFSARYPGRWALQVFPPAAALVDGKNVYHLWMMAGEPAGLNLRHDE